MVFNLDFENKGRQADAQFAYARLGEREVLAKGNRENGAYKRIKKRAENF
jgi:hypothetical protein